MNHWLLKTEPSEYSYDDLVRDRKTVWDGITNALALKHMRAVKKGDLAMIYHTGDEKRIVGVAEIASEPYPAPGADDDKRVVFDLRPKRRLAAPVTLAAVKADPRFKELALVRITRLSVMPVEKTLWDALLKLGEPGGSGARGKR